MKGFIEVTIDGKTELVNMDKVYSVGDREIYFTSDGSECWQVQENYSELKALIEEATESTISKTETVQEIYGFEGTKDALDRLSIRKEAQS